MFISSVQFENEVLVNGDSLILKLPDSPEYILEIIVKEFDSKKRMVLSMNDRPYILSFYKVLYFNKMKILEVHSEKEYLGE